jgi:hypothetical protein
MVSGAVLRLVMKYATFPSVRKWTLNCGISDVDSPVSLTLMDLNNVWAD